MRVAVVPLAFHVQVRVLHALILREIRTRFGEQKLGYLWAVLEPMAFVGALAGLITLSGRHQPGGMPLILFMTTGVVPFFLFRDTMNVAMLGIKSNKALLTFPQVTPIDIILARVVLEQATAVVVLVVLLLMWQAIGVEVYIERPVEVFVWLFVMGLMGAGLGAFVGALSPLFPSVDRLVPVLLGRPLFWVSGVFFTMDTLPPAARSIALYNPLSHGLELIRSAFFIQYESPYADVEYVMFATLIVLAIGFLALRALRRRILIAIQS